MTIKGRETIKLCCYKGTRCHNSNPEFIEKEMCNMTTKSGVISAVTPRGHFAKNCLTPGFEAITFD